MSSHTEHNRQVCPECKDEFSWDDDVMFVPSVDAYYHEDCLHIYPAAFFVTDRYGNPLGMVDNPPAMAAITMKHDEYIDA